MFKAIRVVLETEETLTFEYKTAYLYFIYLIVAILAIGFFIDNYSIMTIGMILMGIYFVVVSRQYRELDKVIKKASTLSPAELSGSKWSFSNPLRITVRK